MANSWCSLSLSFLTDILASNCLTLKNVMFGINRKIGGWWKTFKLLAFFYFLNFGDHLFVFTFGLWTSSLLNFEFYFQIDLEDWF